MAPTRGAPATSSVADPGPAPSTRRPAVALLALGIFVAGLLAAGVFVSTDDPAPSQSSAITPLRVTSGSEIATGFAVGRDRVVTVAHAVDGAVTVGGVGARVLRVDRRSDLALLAVPGIAGRATAVTAAGGTLGRGPAITEAGAGDEARVLRLRDGRAASLSVRVQRAIVAHVRAPGALHAVTRAALELGARVRAGDSGAPVLSGSGVLVGVIFAGSSRRADTAYAVDASAVARLLGRD
jgi:serine protease Do